MKKLSSILLGITMLVVITCSSALAVTLGKYGKGLLIPVTVNDGRSVDTVVGIICSDQTEVYWTLFSPTSNPIVDGQFSCTKNDYATFSLNSVVNDPITGYLVFTANGGPAGSVSESTILNENDNKTITGNAFLIDADNDDAVFVPVVPIYTSDYKAGTDITSMGSDSIQHLTNGISSGDGFVDVRYWTDPEFNAFTNIVIWSTACLNLDVSAENCYTTDSKEFFCHMDTFDSDENRMSLSFPIGCELTQIRPAEVVGWPNFTDGFIRIPKDNIIPVDGSGAIVFSYVKSDVFHAAQTLLASEQDIAPSN